MKRNLFLCILLLTAVTARAGVPVVSIGGQKVGFGVWAHDNCPAIRKGKVTVAEGTAETRISVTLDGVDIVSPDADTPGFRFSLKEETTGLGRCAVYLRGGDNRISSDADALVSAGVSFGFYGDGQTLTLESRNGAGLLLEQTGIRLNVEVEAGVTLSATGKTALQAHGTSGASHILSLDTGSRLHAKPTAYPYYPVAGFSFFEFPGMLPTTGSRVAFDEASGYLKNGSSPWTGELYIAEAAPISVGDEFLSDWSCKGFSDWDWERHSIPALTEGTLTYDKKTHTLTLDNVTLDGSKAEKAYSILCASWYEAYNLDIDSATIVLVGDNKIRAGASQTALYNEIRALTVCGAGKLGVEFSGRNGGLAAINDKTTLRLACGSLTARTTDTDVSNYGFYGTRRVMNPSGRNLVVDGTCVELNLGIGSPFFSLDGLELINASFVTPEGAAYDTERKVLTLGGEEYTGRVVIERDRWPISIAGQAVTRQNRADVLGDGTVSYDPETSTLHLDGANIVAPSGEGIEATLAHDLTVLLSGKNTLTAEGGNGIIMRIDQEATSSGLLTMYPIVTYTGSGTLDVTAQSGISYSGVNMLVDQCGGIDVHSTGSGIIGLLAFFKVLGLGVRYGEGLVVINSDLSVEVTGESDADVLLMDDFYLSQAELVEPSDAEFRSPYLYAGDGETRLLSFRVRATGNAYDLNGDGSVDVSDVTVLVAAVLAGSREEHYDLNRDGSVDVSDVTVLVATVLGQ